MATALNRQDIIEKRAKCVVCGYELTYPEYITDNKCVFHSEFKPQWGLISWLRFAIAEYRLMRLKLNMAKRGLDEKQYMACVGMHKEDIGLIRDFLGMDRLCRELRNFKPLKT